MKRPIKETQDLLQASNIYLRKPGAENERAFLEALEVLETAQDERRSRPLLQWNLLTLGAAAIVICLLGLVILRPPSIITPGGPTTPTPVIITKPVQTADQGNCPTGMIYVPQGTFPMGADANDTDAKSDEQPQRSVMLDAYCIDRTEVSNAQYAAFLIATNHTAPLDWKGSQYPANINQNFKDLPVVNVSWFDARDYCTWQNKQLPTEAQWEKAAKGPDGHKHPWGETFDKAKANASQTTPRGLQVVDSYLDGQSVYGAVNMAGNAAEWVADWYLADSYTRMPDLNPHGPDTSAQGYRVVRGGSFNDAPKNLRTTARIGIFKPDQFFTDVGFRCAR